MSNSTNLKLLGTVIQIGEDLINKIELNGSLFFWLNNFQTIKQKPHFPYTNITNEICCISQFFLELYNHTDEKKYLTYSIKSISLIDIYTKTNMTSYSSFLEGHLNIAYTYLKLFEVTNDYLYLQKAIDITKDVDYNNKSCNYKNGISGSIIVLLHIFLASKDNEIKKILKNSVMMLIQKININKKGIHWDEIYKYTEENIYFNEGSSGVCYALIEIGRIFKDKEIVELISQSINTILLKIQKRTLVFPKNYIQLTCIEDYESIIQSHEQNEDNFINLEISYNEWSYDTIGIIYTIIKYKQCFAEYSPNINISALLNKFKHIFKDKLIEKYSQHMLIDNLIACGELFIKSFYHLNQREFLSLAYQIAFSLQKIYINNAGISNDNGSDKFLLKDKARLGYYLLRVINPIKTRSIVFSEIQIQQSFGRNKLVGNKLAIPHLLLVETIFKKLFPRTLKLLLYGNKKFLSELSTFKISNSNCYISVKTFMLNYIDNKFSHKVNLRVRDIIEFEGEKWHFKQTKNNYALNHLKELFVSLHNKGLSNDHIANSLFLIGDNTKIIKSKWFYLISSPTEFLSDSNLNFKETYFLFYIISNQVCEKEINLFCYKVLSYLSKPTNFIDLSNKLAKFLRITVDDSNGVSFHSKLFDQLNELYKIGAVQLIHYAN